MFLLLLPELAVIGLVLLASIGGHYLFGLLFGAKWLIEATIVIGVAALLFHAAWLWEDRKFGPPPVGKK